MYKSALEQGIAHNNLLEEIANNHLDSLDIEDEDIREAYIKKYCSANHKSFTGKVLDSYAYRLLPGYYIMAAKFMEMEEERYIRLVTKTSVSDDTLKLLEQKIKDWATKLEDEDYIEELKDELFEL